MITTEALVVYKNCSYFGFAKNDKDPEAASSILANWLTDTFGSPSTVPSSIKLISCAENCIGQI